MIDGILWVAFGIAAYILTADRLPWWAPLPAILTGPLGFIIAMCLRQNVPGWAVLASFVLMCWGLTP